MAPSLSFENIGSQLFGSGLLMQYGSRFHPHFIAEKNYEEGRRRRLSLSGPISCANLEPITLESVGTRGSLGTFALPGANLQLQSELQMWRAARTSFTLVLFTRTPLQSLTNSHTILRGDQGMVEIPQLSRENERKTDRSYFSRARAL